MDLCELVEPSEIIVRVPGVVLRRSEMAFQHPGPTINLMAPKWLLVAVPFVIGAAMQLFHLSARPVWIALAVFLCLLAAAVLVWRLWRALTWGRFNQSRFGGQALDWRLDETEVRQTGPFLDTVVPWTAFVHVLDQPTAYVFVLSGSNVMILPRRLLSIEQQRDARALIDGARDRGLIGDMAADLMPPWDLVRDMVREKHDPDA